MVLKSVSVVGTQGRLTIPLEMRRALGVERGDKVTIALIGDELRIRRIGTVAEYTAGALKGDEPAETAERLREIAEEVIAADVIRRGGT